jgi:hypothetical protein
MVTTDIAAPKRNGLAVLWDLLVAPTAAFAELRAIPHWGWALLVTCVLGTVGSYLQVPAAEHITQYALAHNPQLASLPADEVASRTKAAIAIQGYAWLLFPIIAAIAVAFNALLLLIANAIGRGSGTYMKCFGLSANVAFLNFGIGYLLYGIVTSLHDPTSFTSPTELKGTLPSLAWLVPGAEPKTLAFLQTFSVFEIWSIVLLGLGLRAITGISAATAWATPIVIAISGGALAAAFAH